MHYHLLSHTKLQNQKFSEIQALSIKKYFLNNIFKIYFFIIINNNNNNNCINIITFVMFYHFIFYNIFIFNSM